MRKIVYAMNVSMDGYIESSDGSLDWSIPDEELHRHFNDLERETEVHLCGRKMYEILRFWRTAEKMQPLHDFEIEFAHLWNSRRNIVYSKTLEKIDNDDRLVREVNAAEINILKTQPGKYMSVGGAELAASFLKLGLVDEVRLYIIPVVLGGGKPMFQPLSHKISMNLIETRIFHSGVVLLSYQINNDVIGV